MTEPSMPRLVVFDWDGTLVDSAQRIVRACAQAVAACGREPPTPASVRELIGLGLDETFRALLPDAEASMHARAVALYGEFWALGAATPSPTFVGVRETLDALGRAGVLLGVATGKSRRGLDREIRLHGLSHVFAASRCADEAPSKPHPAMLLEVLEELSISPSDALMVGDTEYDMAMARAAGVGAVAVRSGVHGERRLRGHGPRAVLDGVRDLTPWLGLVPEPRRGSDER